MTWLSDHWLDVVGWGGSVLLVLSLLQRRVVRFRAVNLLGCLVLIVFNGALQIWPMVAVNALLAVINVWFLVTLLRSRHDEATFEVIEVGRDDQYLAHVLGTHADDITRHRTISISPTNSRRR